MSHVHYLGMVCARLACHVSLLKTNMEPARLVAVKSHTLSVYLPLQILQISWLICCVTKP